MRNSRFLAFVSLLFGALLLYSCAGRGPEVQPAPADGERTLTVVLFPYIPDAAGDSFTRLVRILKSWFEAQNPGIDLKITMNPEMDLYDMNTLNTLLGNGEGAVNVVEVDTIFLGDLVANNLVQPVNVRRDGILRRAWYAATISGTAYAVPTYLCSNVIYAYHPGIERVRNGGELIEFLTRINPNVTPLVGNYAGNWTLPSDYIDAWADTNTNTPPAVAEAYNLPLDGTTMEVFQSVVESCASNGNNPCLDGTYKDNTCAETVFATGRANGFVGYTERLFFILTNGGRLPSLISAPLGGGSNPEMFVDALVFNPNCAGQCLSDAQTFAAFMNTLAVRNLIAFSQDAPPGTFPRYLLQANETFYTSSPARDDNIYRALRAGLIPRAQPYPNQNFPEKRVALNDALLRALNGIEVRPKRGAIYPWAPTRFPERFAP